MWVFPRFVGCGPINHSISPSCSPLFSSFSTLFPDPMAIIFLIPFAVTCQPLRYSNLPLTSGLSANYLRTSYSVLSNISFFRVLGIFYCRLEIIQDILDFLGVIALYRGSEVPRLSSVKNCSGKFIVVKGSQVIVILRVVAIVRHILGYVGLGVSSNKRTFVILMTTASWVTIFGFLRGFISGFIAPIFLDALASTL